MCDNPFLVTMKLGISSPLLAQKSLSRMYGARKRFLRRCVYPDSKHTSFIYSGAWKCMSVTMKLGISSSLLAQKSLS